jgi:HAD superfamily hydrolase (TIGR01509 family)
MGMSSPDWSEYLQDRLGVALPSDEIAQRVAAQVIDVYAARLPLLPGAQQVIRALAPNWKLGLASSSNRSVIEVFLDGSGLRDCFGATVSSEEVPRGKPAPDVYLDVLHRLDADAGQAAAVEDSSNGIRSAHAARLRVVALPNPHYPPTSDALQLARRVVRSLDEVPVALESLWSCR